MKEIKPSLAWTLKDYLATNEEPPPCVIEGKTEGMAMEEDEVEEWCKDTILTLSVLKEEYPEKFKDQLLVYFADLEYLHTIGKISSTEMKHLKKDTIFNFGQE